MTRVEKLIFLFVLVSYSFFYNGAGVNHMSRYDAIFNFVEPSPSQFTFQIDRFMQQDRNTIDWSFYDGHYYSNKAPGPTLIGIPLYFITYNLQRIFGLEYSENLLNLHVYLINFFVTVLPLAISAIFFFRLCLEKFSSLKYALILTGILYFLTPVFPYASSLWGHDTAAAFIIIALSQMFVERGNLKLFSFSLGMAVLSDYLLIPIVIILGVLHLIKTKQLVGIALGAVLPVILFLGYNYLCFDNIFVLPQLYSNPEFVDKSGVYGMLGKFDYQVMIALLFSQTRGILFQSPILILSIIGIFSLKKYDYQRTVCVISAVGLLILNSSFNGWHGGMTVCARYLIVGMPFFVLLIPYVDFSEMKQKISKIFAVISYLIMTAISFVNPLCSEIDPSPLIDVVFPRLISGNFFNVSYLPRREGIEYLLSGNFNLFTLIGIPQQASFILFVVLQCGFAYLIFRTVTTRTDS